MLYTVHESSYFSGKSLRPLLFSSTCGECIRFEWPVAIKSVSVAKKVSYKVSYSIARDLIEHFSNSQQKTL